MQAFVVIVKQKYIKCHSLFCYKSPVNQHSLLYFIPLRPWVVIGSSPLIVMQSILVMALLFASPYDILTDHSSASRVLLQVDTGPPCIAGFQSSNPVNQPLNKISSPSKLNKCRQKFSEQSKSEIINYPLI